MKTYFKDVQCVPGSILHNTTELAQSSSQYILLCIKMLAQSTSQYFFVPQSLHKVLPSTTLHSTLHTPHFTLHPPHFTLHTSHLTLHFTLHT